MMQFELMRLSLFLRTQVDSFERRKKDGTSFTREEWLRAVFSETIAFTHRKETFHYVPDLHVPASPLLVGRIGRQIKVVENEPPEEGLVETKRDAWRAALVLIDPRHHPDGQKVANEHQATIGQPVALFESLVTSINNRAEPFILEAHAIAPSETFWHFAEANSGEVTFVEFEFVAPNMFGQADDYDREMRDMRDKEKAQKAKLTIESKDGLNLETDRVKAAVDYAAKGGGSIKAKTKRKRRYNSKAKAKKISLPNAQGENELSKLITLAVLTVFTS
jgi:hypothetical protein